MPGTAILKAHGRFGLDRALAPAIQYAEGGFPVASRISYAWANMLPKLAADPGATRSIICSTAPRRTKAT